MPPDTTDVVILHTVGAFFGDEDAAALRSQVAERVPDVSLRVADTPAQSREYVQDAEVVLTLHLDDVSLDHAENLTWVQGVSAGLDMFDAEALAANDVILTGVSGAHAEPIAQQVLGYLLCFERDLLQGFEQQRQRVWHRYRGGELTDRTLGVVGLGAIGSRVAELGTVFGMTVIGTKATPEPVPGADEVFGPGDLDRVLARADYLVLACPLTAETRGLIGPAELDTLSSSAVLVNVARGAIVDEAALTRRLQQDQLGGAALDVFEEEPLPSSSPLWDLPNVIVTPHMGGFTPKLWDRVGAIVASNVAAYRDGTLESVADASR